MQNILSVIFEVESEGYQALSTLRQKAITKDYAIMQMALVKRTGKELSVCDSFSSGANTMDDTLAGGVLGSLLGILGGPLGVLLMGSYGALAGSVLDAEDAIGSATLLETVADKLYENEVALILFADEADESALDAELGKYKAEILRFDAATVADEVEEAEKTQREMERQARMQLRKEKKENRKARIEEKRAKISSEFETLRKDLTETAEEYDLTAE